MLSHRAIWEALDALAERHGLSTSGLAKLAGLDATAFNPSKRVSKDGRERWPSTESIAKVLEATNETFDSLLSGAVSYFQPSSQAEAGTAVPLLGFAQAGSGGYFDAAGFPVGQGWDEVRFPGLGDGTAYALEVAGDSMCGGAHARGRGDGQNPPPPHRKAGGTAFDQSRPCTTGIQTRGD
jgi:phage repressor protein C with HTH and peptisase S24 domain